MSNNVNGMNRKVLTIVVSVALLTAALLIYELPQPSRISSTALTYENYYYQLQVPNEEQRVIGIVFDDGWLTQYTAARPILDEYGFKATFAIITEAPDRRPAYMSWDQIIALNNQGHDIESHTVSHLTLTSQDATSIEYELSQSKQDLIKHGINAPLFVYPEGKGAGDIDIEKLVQQHYYAACSINHGSLDMNQPFDPYAIPRYVVGKTTTMEMFERYVNQASDSTIVIIYYHNINNESESTSVTPEAFAAQMQYLHDNNFTVQTLKQLFTTVAPEK